MKIEFLKIDIKNFKGIKHQTIEFSNNITNILGANHVGKTTTADAIHWVLFGTNTENKVQFGIDPKDEHNNVIHHLENKVSLTMLVDNKEKCLTKIRKETWGKPKGQLEEVIMGHTTDCFIDGNKYSITDYQKEINAICSEALFRAITNTNYFPKLKAEEQRSLLIKMVGDVSLEDVVKQNNEFKALLNDINGEELKNYRMHLSYNIKQIKSELSNIPSRITENEQILQDVTNQGTDFISIRKRIEEIDNTIKQYDEQLQDATTKISQDYNKKAEQRSIINNLKYKLQDIVDKTESRNREKRNAHEHALADLQNKLTEAQYNKDIKTNSLNLKKQELQSIELRIKDFRNKWEEVEQRTFTWDVNHEICPHCGQPLPLDNIEELKEKAKKQWTETLINDQDKLDVEAKTLKETKQKIEAEINDYQNKIDTITQETLSIENNIKTTKNCNVEHIDYKEDKEYILLNNKVLEEQEKLNTLNPNTEISNATQIIKDKKQTLLKQRDELNIYLSREKLIEVRKERIAKLENEIKKLNQQLTDLEHKDFIAENIEKASIKNLETRVNKLFTLVKFKMFETLINGSTKPTCQLTMHGVPYNDLSNSEKINAGLDLIRAMNAYNNTYAPIIIDNAESCNQILTTESQQIRLFVSNNEQLTIVNE